MKEVCCLLYHRVLPPELMKYDIYNIAISTVEFEKHMKNLSRKHTVGRFESNWDEQPNMEVVVTFDDGYADNFLYAYPILEKYGIPATIFVSTENVVKQGEMWWDQLATIMLEENFSYKNSFKLIDELFGYEWETATYEDRLETTLSLRWLLRMESDHKLFDDWKKQLETWKGSKSSLNLDNRLMTIDELYKLSESELITIGAHTYSHHSLGSMSDEQQYIEISKSINTLKEITQKEIDVFSYPFGTGVDYTEGTERILKDLGIKKAATTMSRTWNPTYSSYLIPRKTVKKGGNKDLERVLEI